MVTVTQRWRERRDSYRLAVHDGEYVLHGFEVYGGRDG